MEINSWLTRNRLYRIIGATLLICALGLSIGGLVTYSNVSKSLISLNNEHGTTQVINSDNRVRYFQTHYLLGTEGSDQYVLTYDNVPTSIAENHYTIKGEFVNETEEHFAAIELNFSLLDKEGNKIGDAYASCNGLNPAQIWSFTADGRTNNVATTAIIDDIRITY